MPLNPRNSLRLQPKIPTRRAAGHGALVAALASLGVFALLVAVLAWPHARFRPGDSPLVVFCAAGLRQPVAEACARFQQETGQEVQLQFGGSQTLLSSLEVSGTGDLFLSADEPYIDLARGKNLLAGEAVPLATQRPVLIFPHGKSRGMKSVADVLAAGLKIAQADPDLAAIGQVTRTALTPHNLWERLRAATTVFKPTVNDVLGDVLIGAVDVGIVWDSLATQHSNLDVVSPPELAAAQARIMGCALAASRNLEGAAQLLQFLAARDRGGECFEKSGFAILAGRYWNPPEITLYAGALLRPALEETITEFEQREGVKVNRVYNGCGILVGQMKAGRAPDAYFACDRQFMAQVSDLFPQAADVATNDLVILVAKGNPHGIASLADLAQPGLRVGVGHEQQCALGQITQDTFQQAGLSGQIEKNIKVRVPAGDMLVNEMRAGALDAAVAYLANAVNSGDVLDAVRIRGLPCATAVQPYGIHKNSAHRAVAERLFEAIQSETSQRRFRENGFQWKHAGTSPPAPAPEPAAP